MAALPKAELHCHIEGSAPPDLVRRLARRNGIDLPDSLFADGTRFAWKDFISFLAAYDAACDAMRRPEDYRDVIYDYLGRCAREGAIYVEVFSSPEHVEDVGMDYAAQLEGLAAGIDAAEAECGIVGRIIPICLRHRGPERALAVARTMLAAPHPYVVGFGMAGDELRYAPADFAPAFRLVADAGYPCTAHAGEVAGPQSVRATLDALPVSRIGHGVRASEDPRLLDEIARRGVVLEVCPGSNIALGVYRNLASHPLRRLIDAGCKVTLNSDDPPYFDTSIGREYATAGHAFGLTPRQLLDITETAVAAAFVDRDTRRRLTARIAGHAASV
ncbi:MAG: adenosine deaminase [Alphaproteobacteria bacterium]|nr:adenosine deaminase [Alphaproteobacteria bacterium]